MSAFRERKQKQWLTHCCPFLSIIERTVVCISVGSPYWTDDQLDDRVYVAMPAGQELVLRCPAAGSPSPNITWMKDGRRFDQRLVGRVS